MKQEKKQIDKEELNMLTRFLKILIFLKKHSNTII